MLPSRQLFQRPRDRPRHTRQSRVNGNHSMALRPERRAGTRGALTSMDGWPSASNVPICAQYDISQRMGRRRRLYASCSSSVPDQSRPRRRSYSVDCSNWFLPLSVSEQGICIAQAIRRDDHPPIHYQTDRLRRPCAYRFRSRTETQHGVT